MYDLRQQYNVHSLIVILNFLHFSALFIYFHVTVQLRVAMHIIYRLQFFSLKFRSSIYLEDTL